MSKRTLTAGLILAVALLGVGALFASNMGFKLNYELANAATQGGTGIGANALALSYNRQAGVDTAQELINDIGSTNVTNIQRYVESSNSFQVRDNISGPNFNLLPGEGYFLTMTSTVNYITVGSHAPTATVNLDSAATQGGSGIGANFYAPPYHQTASTAQELINDIGSTSVTNVQRYVESTNSFQVRDNISGPNFNLVPGEAYFVTMTSDVAYNPSHY